MVIEHKQVLSKLVGFLTGEISKAEIYQWALSIVVSSEYENLIKQDKLVEQIFQFLIDIEKPKHELAPTKKVLEYFVKCLKAEKIFSAQDYKALIGDKSAPAAATNTKQKSSQIEKSPLPLSWLVMAAKIYALIFVIISILLNTAIVIKPDLLIKPGEIAPTLAEVGKEAIPHLVYGILILFAMSVKVPRVVFYGVIPVGIWGMFFYWSSATSMILKHGVSLFTILFLVVFMALPPTAVFFVLLSQWFNHLKEKNSGEKE